MKLSELHFLKEVVLVHKQVFPTKEFAKQKQYDTFKELILDRIGLIEGIEMKKQKYLEDINHYVERLETKFKVVLIDKGEPLSEKPAEGLIPA